MRLYLDEDSCHPRLAQLLRKSGHEVQVPADVGLAGKADALQLINAIRTRRVLLTRNYRDFEYLHLLVMQSGGHHPGILVVRQDNDPTRDLTPRGIARAIRNLEGAAVSVANEYLILNAWQ
jgi:predicted nuclease of predicted toxin-antitoxin system